MTMSATSNPRLVATVLAVLLLPACRPGSGGACGRDSDCGPGDACNARVCVPRTAGEQSFAVELVPASESPWAVTERTGVVFSGDPASLVVEGEKMVEGMIGELDTKNLPAMAAARVLLSLPSAIGNADRQIEAAASIRSAAGPVQFTIPVPESAVGQSAMLRIVPVAPVDRYLPVWTVPLASLGLSVSLAIPHANDLTTVEGTLQTALGASEPVADYAVRALVGDRLVSNVDRTTALGHFTVHIPRTVDADSVSLELTPPETATARPTMATKLSAAKLNVGALRLPPFGKAIAIDVPVTAMGTSKKVPGVTLRFFTAVQGAVGNEATASFRREFQTDKDGMAHAQLLPGNTGEIRNYAVAAIPPPNSEYAARCFPSYAVAAPSGQPRVGASLELLPKVEITGQVLDADGAPVGGVLLTAVRRDSTFVEACASEVASAQSTATTGPDGSFRLLIEPGTYQLSYEPPMGSNSPLLIEDGVLLAQSSQRSVMLPSGALAEGSVTTPKGDGAGGCEVRIFTAGKNGSLPDLRAHVRTDANGHFRVTVPRAP
jgi:hypothetical protein